MNTIKKTNTMDLVNYIIQKNIEIRHYAPENCYPAYNSFSFYLTPFNEYLIKHSSSGGYKFCTKAIKPEDLSSAFDAELMYSRIFDIWHEREETKKGAEAITFLLDLLKKG